MKCTCTKPKHTRDLDTARFLQLVDRAMCSREEQCYVSDMFERRAVLCSGI